MGSFPFFPSFNPLYFGLQEKLKGTVEYCTFWVLLYQISVLPSWRKKQQVKDGRDGERELEVGVGVLALNTEGVSR